MSHAEDREHHRLMCHLAEQLADERVVWQTRDFAAWEQEVSADA